MPQRKRVIPDAVYVFNQKRALKASFGNYDVKSNRSRLTIEGILRPFSLCDEYRFKIVYDVGSRPRIFILAPELLASDIDPVPHIYDKNQPCLYYPGNKEFTKDMLISETIIPWLSLWLYFYEVWKATGEWLGGGIHDSQEKG